MRILSLAFFVMSAPSAAWAQNESVPMDLARALRAGASPFGMKLLASLLLVAFACSRPGSEPQQQAPADSVATSQITAHVHPDSAAVQRFRAMVPDSVLVRTGACPFECCMYGDWVAIDSIPVYDAPRAAGTSSFTLAAGDSMRAETGTVYVTSLALLAVEDSVFNSRERRPWILPGDTLVLLEPIGEGYWTAWRRGEILYSVPPIGEAWSREGRGRTIGKSEREWWVRINVKGRTGWFRGDRHRVRGSDACG